MRRLWLLMAVACTLGAKDPIPVETTIAAVRLHPGEGWVTRKGTVQLPEGGSSRVIIPGLPAGLRFDDLRLRAQGPAGTRIGDLTVREAPQTYRERTEWKRLEKEAADLRGRLALLDLRQKNQAKARQLFLDLKAAQTKGFQQSLTTGALKPQSILDFSFAVESRSLELARQDAALSEERSSLKSRADRNDEAMEGLKREGEANPTVISVELEVPRACSVGLELSFRVQEASWAPAYEARLSPDKRHLELVLFAAVKQATNENWNGISLELLSQAPSGRLDLPAGIRLPGLSYQESGARKPGIPVPENPVSPAALTTLKVPGQVQVRTGEEQRFRIGSLDLVPSFRYLAIPRQGSDVYLMAMVLPAPGFPLVGGSPVDMLQGTERVGTLQMEVPGPGEPLRLSYGPVPGLTARREVLERNHSEIGDKTKERQWVFKESFEVESTFSTPVEVEVQDRTVTSGTDSVKVDQVSGTTPGWETIHTGIRRWILQLPPGGKATVLQKTRIQGPLVGHLVNVGDLSLEGN